MGAELVKVMVELWLKNEPLKWAMKNVEPSPEPTYFYVLICF